MSPRVSPKQNGKIDMTRSINPDLLVSKLFYLFFYGAFGSLFPLLAIYFKQLGMNATHAGILVGIRPFVEFISAPLWGGLADKFRKGKPLLVLSVLCWIIFTSALFFVKPSTSYCLSVYNRTEFVLEPLKYDTGKIKLVSTKLDKFSPAGVAPEFLHHTHNISGYNSSAHGGILVKPPASTRVYLKSEVHKIFFILLILVIVGEFFCAPAITLADACTLHFLGNTPDCYGRQRMYGSVGWAISMFIMGMALDYGIFSNTDCGQTDIHEKNYTICFISFVVLMIIALIISTRFKFSYDHQAKHIDMDEIDQKINTDQKRSDSIDSTDQLKSTESMLVHSDWTQPNLNPDQDDSKWISALRILGTVHYASFLFIVWWFGFGVGLIFCFLFWHLQDIGGSPSIFGIASVINHASEIVAYFFTTDLIGAIGHVKVLYVGLIANIARFLYVSWLEDPWFVLPLEFVQGISHAAVWAAATSYIALAVPPAYKSSAQGILQGVHYGLGRACGALFGGIVITHYGSSLMFRGYGIACAIILIIFFAINRFLDVEGAHTPDDASDEAEPVQKNLLGTPMHTMYSTTEVGLANAATMSSHYGSTDTHHSDKHSDKKCLRLT